MNTNIHFWSYLAQFFLEWKFSQTKNCRENEIRLLGSIAFFFFFFRKSCRLCGKILYSGVDHRWQYGACALHAGYLRLQTHALKKCNIYCFSTATVVARTRLNVTLHVQCLFYSLFSSTCFCQSQRSILPSGPSDPGFDNLSVHRHMLFLLC